MSERRYSISEIDAMRRSIETMTIRSGMSYNGRDMAAKIEDRLRTYMQNGTEPIELAQAASAIIQRDIDEGRVSLLKWQDVPKETILR